MATTKQKAAARRNLEKARRAQKKRKSGSKAPRRSGGLTTAETNDLKRSQFAFPDQRKEPLIDKRHVRNAIARFDQVEDVSDADRDRAWKRIRSAAKKYDIKVEATDWRELFEGGKSRKQR